MSNVRVITIEPQTDAGPSVASPCDTLLQNGLKTLGYPPIESDPSTTSDPSAKPYDVQFEARPKAWGNFPRTKPVTIQIPRDKTRMHASLRQEVEAAYSLGGWFFVDEFAAGAFGKGQFFSLKLSKPRGAGGGNEMMQQLRENISEERGELFRVFDTVRDELDAKETRGLALLQSYALCRAVQEELPACDKATIEEARRYLSLSKNDEKSIRDTLAHGRAGYGQLLTGPEGRSLVQALEYLRKSYLRQQAAQRRFEATLPEKDLQKGMVWLSLGVIGLPMMIVNSREALQKAN